MMGRSVEEGGWLARVECRFQRIGVLVLFSSRSDSEMGENSCGWCGCISDGGRLNTTWGDQ